MNKLEREKIESLAQELVNKNISYADAYPMHKWAALGLPQDQEFFDVLNIYISYLKKLKSYLQTSSES